MANWNFYIFSLKFLYSQFRSITIDCVKPTALDRCFIQGSLHHPATVFKSIVFSESFVVTRPLPRDWGMAEDHGAPEAGQLSRAWTRDRRETKSRQRMTSAKSP